LESTSESPAHLAGNTRPILVPVVRNTYEEDTMKTKSRIYLTAVECPQIRKTKVYENRSRNREQAMRKGQARFFAEFPQVLKRKLTIGEFVITLRSALRLYGRA